MSQSIAQDANQQESNCGDDETIALILDKYLNQLQRGLRPSIDSLCDAYPSLADELKKHLKGMQFLHNMIPPLASSSPVDDPFFAELPNQAKQIGDYKLVREVGRGGMGVVYEALQISLGRRVALKILPFAAVLDQRQIARFQNEAQAAAQLHHPNIVPVHAIGSDRGTYFYSMQFVDGRSLDHAIADLRAGFGSFVAGTSHKSPSLASLQKHEDARIPNSTTIAISGIEFVRSSADSDRGFDAPTLKDSTAGEGDTIKSIRSRDHIRRVAEIGMQAALALQYAHENGIVHRDIKPSNLMLDRDGKLWITDFGLAQGISQNHLTRTGDIVGTIRYMSPEQAAGKNHCVDHRTDIYSLGLTLYELVTLRSAVSKTNRAEMLQEIESTEPRRLRKLNPSISIDFENIILKSLSKQREDRYDSAGAMAADLLRFLEGKPTLAKQPTWLDLATRWVIRHAKAVAVSLIATLFATGLLLAIALAFAAKTHAVKDANLRAMSHLKVANSVVDRFGAEMLSRLEPISGTEELQRDIASDSIDYLESFARYAANDHSQFDALIRAYLKLAKLYELCGEDQNAREAYKKADALLVQHKSIAVSDEDFLCHNNYACLLMRIGKLDEAQAILEAAIETYQHSSSEVIKLCLLKMNLGKVLKNRGMTEQADGILAQVLEKLQPLTIKPPRSTESCEPHYLLVNVIVSAASSQHMPIDVSKEMLQVGRELATALVESNQRDPKYQHQLHVCELTLGACFSKSSDLRNTIDWLTKGTNGMRQLVALWPRNRNYLSDLATGLNNLGQTQLDARDIREAKASFDDSAKILEELVSQSNDSRSNVSLGGVYNNQAIVAELLGNLSESADLLERAIAIQESEQKRMPGNAICQQFLSQHHVHLDRVRQKLSTLKEPVDVSEN